MTLTFADTHNMIAYLTKSNASEGFNQIIDFLNGSSIKYALTVNPNIYVSCIKQFWTSVAVKKVNDVTRLQALVDKKKVVITEATIRYALRLDDAEGVECLPNEEIFVELARMGAQVGDLSSHTTKYSSSALTQKAFANMKRVGKEFSGVETPLFEGMIVERQVGEGADEVNVEDVSVVGVAAEGAASVAEYEVHAAVDEPSLPSPPPPTQQPLPSQDIPSTSQNAGISIDLLQNLLDTCTTLTKRVEHLEQDKIAQALEITKLRHRVKKLERRNKASKLKRLKRVGTTHKTETSDDIVMDDVSKQGRMITDMDADVDVTLKDVVAKDVQDAEIEESSDDVDIELAELQEVLKVVTTAKLITEVVTAASATITAVAPQLTTAAAPTLTTAPSAARRRKSSNKRS
nr:xylulose kinase-1 [Tanacetum cinerariifolium]